MNTPNTETTGTDPQAKFAYVPIRSRYEILQDEQIETLRVQRENATRDVDNAIKYRADSLHLQAKADQGNAVGREELSHHLVLTRAIVEREAAALERIEKLLTQVFSTPGKN